MVFPSNPVWSSGPFAVLKSLIYSLDSHQRSVRVPVYPHPAQHWDFSYVLIFVLLISENGITCDGFNLHLFTSVWGWAFFHVYFYIHHDMDRYLVPFCFCSAKLLGYGESYVLWGVLVWKSFSLFYQASDLARKMVHLRTGLGGVGWGGASKALKGSGDKALPPSRISWWELLIGRQQTGTANLAQRGSITVWLRKLLM